MARNHRQNQGSSQAEAGVESNFLPPQQTPRGPAQFPSTQMGHIMPVGEIYQSAGEASSLPPQEASGQYQPPPIPLGGGTASASTAYHGASPLADFPDSVAFRPRPRAQTVRAQRTSAPGRGKACRTRSGCYTCRQRRIKCGEEQPVCERCRKGDRECEYPKSSTASAKNKAGSSASSHDGDDELDKTSVAAVASWNGSKTSSPKTDQSASPAASSKRTSATPSHATSPDEKGHGSPSDYSSLPADLRFYLDYFCREITHYHYLMARDSDGFFHTNLPSIATRPGGEALLYAVVSFAAYHHTVQDPNGNMDETNKYYYQSVHLLNEALNKEGDQPVSTLLTILQLAVFEEYLGDWTLLMKHQQAAFEIFTRLFTPDSIMHSPAGRMILRWYTRHDVFVGMLSGFESRLSREWFVKSAEYFETAVAQHPDDLACRMEAWDAELRLLANDMSNLNAKGKHGEIPPETFAAEHGLLTQRLYAWRTDSDPALFLGRDSDCKQPLDEDDNIGPYVEGNLYDPTLFSRPFSLAQWHSMVLVHTGQDVLTLKQEPTPETTKLALNICQIFEVVERWTLRPNGALFVLQACLGMAPFFVPRDQGHHMWMRRKLALIESLGYVVPLNMRKQLSQAFQDPTCKHWLLPNEEGLTPIIRTVRSIATGRLRFAREVAGPSSQKAVDVREMTAVFGNVNLTAEDDEPDPSSATFA